MVWPSNNSTEKKKTKTTKQATTKRKLFPTQDFCAFYFFFLSLLFLTFSFCLRSHNRLFRCWRTLRMISSSNIMHASYSSQGTNANYVRILLLLWALHTYPPLCAVSTVIGVNVCSRCLHWKLSISRIQGCLWCLLFPYPYFASLFC